MGFVKRNLELEEYLDSAGIKWEKLSDSEYQTIFKNIDPFVGDSSIPTERSGDHAISKVTKKLPVNGYLFSAPDHGIFSIGSHGPTFGYRIKNLNKIDREILNRIECILVDEDYTFACMFNHEWQAHCPELIIEKYV